MEIGQKIKEKTIGEVPHKNRLKGVTLISHLRIQQNTWVEGNRVPLNSDPVQLLVYRTTVPQLKLVSKYQVMSLNCPDLVYSYTNYQLLTLSL